MSLITHSILLDMVGIVTALLIVAIIYLKWSFQYWRRCNVPDLDPSLPFGNIEPPYNRTVSFGTHMKNIYDRVKAKQLKYCGIYLFATPALLVTDLDLLRNIMAKDFQHFSDRRFYYNEKADPISAHLIAVGGEKWRKLRTKLNPAFTASKIKHIFDTLLECGHVLEEMMLKKHNKLNEPIDIKEVLGRFTTDVIGSCVFGLDCKSLEDENSPFRVYGKKAFEERILTISFVTQFPKIAKLLGMRQAPKDVSDFFTKVVTDTVNYRKKNHVKRKDFLQSLIEIKNNKTVEENGQEYDWKTLTIQEIVAQSFVFFLAGFETSSTLMTFALYELAKNQVIQEKVRNEIQTVLRKHNGEITYDSLSDMKYMNQVIDEALRKYPPLPLVTRQCVKDYQIPDTNVNLKKGTVIDIPIYGIHMDKEYYPDPDKFDPERFSEENKQSRHPYAHIPFGEGPRICIARRFGLIQAKVGLTILLKKYKFSVNPKTKEPLKMSPSFLLVLAAEGGIWLDLVELLK